MNNQDIQKFKTYKFNALKFKRFVKILFGLLKFIWNKREINRCPSNALIELNLYRSEMVREMNFNYNIFQVNYYWRMLLMLSREKILYDIFN